MSVGYRAILTLPAKSDATTRVEEQLRSWLREKKRNRSSTVEVDDWDGPGVHRVGSEATLVVVHAERQGERRRTYRLIERNDVGTFTVTVYVLDRQAGGREGDVVVVEVGKSGVDDEAAVIEAFPVWWTVGWRVPELKGILVWDRRVGASRPSTKLLR